MKRQVIAVLLGSLFALPAFANDEIDAGTLPKDVALTKTRAQVYAEIVAARQSANWMVNSTLGTVSGHAAPTQVAGKSRSEVRAELERARAAGDYVVNAELGTTANQL